MKKYTYLKTDIKIKKELPYDIEIYIQAYIYKGNEIHTLKKQSTFQCSMCHYSQLRRNGTKQKLSTN